MSMREYLRRHDEHQRQHAVMAMRPLVSAAVAANAHPRDRCIIDDAVSEALTQLVAAGEHIGDPEQVKERWILYAKRRAIDEQRSPEYRRRDPVAIDEHARALAISVTGDLGQATEQDRAEWLTREQLNELNGDERAWVEAWYDQILAGSLPLGAQPRGLAQTFGWTPAKTKSISRRTRLKMAAFAEKRATGEVCEQRRALIDQFITATAAGELTGDLDDTRYKQILFHIAGCESCRRLWETRRRTLLGRAAAAILPLPAGWLADIAHGLREKLHGLAANAHTATWSVRHRLGLGGGTSAVAAGSGAAALSGKATAICAAVACAAAAGGTALVSAVPAILPLGPKHASRHPPRHAAAAPSPAPNAHTASFTAPPRPAPAVAHSAGRSTSTPGYTPGDLTGAASASPSTATASALSAHAASSTSSTPPVVRHVPHAPTEQTNTHSVCTPGDLGC